MAKKCNSSKKEAILQLLNFICDSSVTEIAELADGKILLKTIQDKFPQFEHDYSPYNDHVEDIKSETMDVEFQTVDGNIENANKCTEDRFKCLQKFIDDCYDIKSCEIISFADCIKKEDMEILKVTVFVLSECVKHLLQINQEHLKILYHLDMKYQVELEDCFKTLISERNTISKDIVEKLLSKSAMKSSPYLTPVRQSARCKQRKSFSLSPKEEVFSSSPLKVYFESPVFKKEDILMKDRVIENLQKVLNEDEEQSSELLHRLSESEKQIKEKDKSIQKYQKKIAQMETEINHLQNSCQSTSCKAEKKELEKKIKVAETTASFHLENYNRLQEQNSQYENEILKLENKLDEEKNKGNKSSQISINAENERLKKRLEDLELKLCGYKMQLSQKVLTELKAKNSSGNLNQTYENVWAVLDKVRKGDEENLAFAIEEDNKRLFYKNKELLKENKELLEKIRIIEGNKSSGMFTSVANESYLPVRECTIPEMEKCRDFEQSNVEDCNLSDEPSYTVLNNSNNNINSEESVFLPNSEICPENQPEAVLWRNYDDHEIENAGNINFSENLHIDANSNLEIKYTQSDTSFHKENEYIFENLNFNGFLKELKKLTKNGSFQKVQKLLEKNIKMKRASKSNSLDIQELLQIITECMNIVVSVNGFSNVQDKCTSTDAVFQDEGCSTEKHQNIQGEINSVCETCEIELKNYIKIIEELTKEKTKLEREYENLILQDEHREKQFTAVLVNYKKEEFEFLDCRRKYEHLKNIHSKCINAQKKILEENIRFKSSLRKSEKLNEPLREQNEKLTEDLQDKESKLKELKDVLQIKENTLIEFNENLQSKENELKALKTSVQVKQYKLYKIIEHLQVKEKELNEREKVLKTGMNPFNLDSKESFDQKPNSLTVTGSFPNTSQDAANESTLSGIYQKNQSQYVLDQSQYPNTDEADFVYYNSLENIKNGDADSRVEELKRRNSLYPMHLQSSYPTEVELNSTYNSMYIKNEERCKEENYSKKRKLDDLIPEEPSTSSRRSCKSSGNYNDSSKKSPSSSVASKILKKYKTSTPKRIAKIVKRVCNSHNSLPMKR